VREKYAKIRVVSGVERLLEEQVVGYKRGRIDWVGGRG